MIFDLDGTVLDTLDDLALSVNLALRHFGYPERTRDEVRAFVGNGIRLLVERAAPSGINGAELDALFEEFKRLYALHCADKTAPYPGIPELLKALRTAGVPSAVVSNKADAAVKTLCERFFGNAFAAAVGEREGVRRKPAPDTVLEVMTLLGASPESTVYVGDSDVDILTARNAGIDCISVSWGFRDRDFLAASGASTTVASPEELTAVLL